MSVPNAAAPRLPPLRRLRAAAPWAALKLLVALLYGFLLAPILITFAVSFNAGNQSRFPPVGFSLRWWSEALAPIWLQPIGFSLALATLTAVLCTALGLPLAFALARWRFPGRAALRALTFGPLLLPALVTGMALLQFFYVVGLGGLVGFPALVVAHVVISVAFSVRTIGVSLATMPSGVERAAASLGATPGAVFRRVTLPLVKNGAISGAVFAFIHSFTDLNVSLFLARPGQEPITVRIIGHLEWGYGPTLAAVGIMTLLIPLALIAVLERVGGLSDFVYAQARHG